MDKHTVLLLLMMVSHSSDSSRTPTISKSNSLESSKSLLVLIPDKIDVEEEARLYDEICDASLWPSHYLTILADPTSLTDSRL